MQTRPGVRMDGGRLLGCVAAIVAIALMALAPSVQAAPQTTTSTVVNFDPGAPRPDGYPHGAQVVKLDTDGNAIDAKADSIAYFEGSYYLYGESYGCSYDFVNFCGFRAYTSEDLVHWESQGTFIDPTTSAFARQACTPSPPSTSISCFGPQVVYDDAADTYRLWFYTAFGHASTPSLYVLEGDTPLGPWTNPTNPANIAHCHCAFDIFQDDDGTAFISYTTSGFGLNVQQLNASMTDAVPAAPTPITRPSGSIVSPQCQAPGGIFGENFIYQTRAVLDAWKSCGIVESTGMMRHGDTYYLTFGDPICAFCFGTSTVYFKARSPLGPWKGIGGSPSYDPDNLGRFDPYPLTADSCGGQPFHMSTLPAAHGGPQYLYVSVLWENSRNEGSANHHWASLHFEDDGDISPVRCKAEQHFRLAHAVARGEAPPRAINLAAVAQGSSLTQTMEAPATGTISSIELPLYQKTNPTHVFGPPEGRVSEALTVTLVGPGGQTVKTFAPAEVSWTPTRVRIDADVPVLRGEQLTLTLASATPQGRYATLFDDNDGYRDGRVSGSGEAAELVSHRSDLLFTATVTTAGGAVTFGG